jgi:hypothetical protein
MSSTIHTQAKSLFDDMKGSEGLVSWQIGRVINALLEKAKEEQADNVVLDVIDPLVTDRDQKFVRGGMKADDVRAIVGQIVTATTPEPHFGLA